MISASHKMFTLPVVTLLLSMSAIRMSRAGTSTVRISFFGLIGRSWPVSASTLTRLLRRRFASEEWRGKAHNEPFKP